MKHAALLKQQGFYQTQAWRRVRRSALIRDGYLCQYCKQSGRITPATEVHHVKPLEDYPTLALDVNNLTSLCWRCHETTKHKRVTRKPPVGVRIIKA